MVSARRSDTFWGSRVSSSSSFIISGCLQSDMLQIYNMYVFFLGCPWHASPIISFNICQPGGTWSFTLTWKQFLYLWGPLGLRPCKFETVISYWCITVCVTHLWIKEEVGSAQAASYLFSCQVVKGKRKILWWLASKQAVYEVYEVQIA